MPPSASWPDIRNPLAITPEDHANHRSIKGVPLPEDLIPGLKAHKQAGLILKIARKPHLKATKTMRTRKKKK